MPRSPASPFEAALRDAKHGWWQALAAMKPEMEAFAETDPHAIDLQESWRQRLMAEDRGGHLRRGQETARRAVALATSPKETYEATVWLAIIECDRGDHPAELQSVRKMVMLQPKSPISWGALRRAAKCNHLWQLAQEADTAMELLEGNPSAIRSPAEGKR
jgi:hypothetical protein